MGARQEVEHLTAICTHFLLLLSSISNAQESASCASRCDESYFPGRQCYCNEACSQYENCCFDYYAVCQPDFVWSEDWSDWNGHSYKYFNDLSITWLEAEEACHDHGAMLLSINNQEEHRFMEYSVLKKRTLSAFIGGIRQSQGAAWVWLDGNRMGLPTDTFHAWGDGQPDNVDDKTCLVTTNYKYWAVRKVILGSYVWRSHSCRFNAAQEIQGYICERTLQCIPNPCQNNGTCQYIAGDDETYCNCQSGFVGERCEIEVTEGEAWTRCGETNLTDKTGTITSPLFPRPYPANVRCQWMISSQHQQTIALTLLSLDLEPGKDCVFDSLTIYDGNDTNSPTLLPPTCGSLTDLNTDMQSGIVSSRGSVLVVFSTDKSVESKGFKLSYDKQICGLGSGDSGCSTRSLFTSPCGKVEVSGGPIDGLSCTWTISVNESSYIQLNFLEFLAPDTGMDCYAGALSIYNGNSNQSDPIATYCGERLPWKLYSINNQVHVQMTDFQWVVGRHRIVLEYTAVEKETREFLSDYTEVRGQSGNFTLETYPVNEKTQEQDIYRWLVVVSAGDAIRLNYSLNIAQKIPGHFKIHEGFSEHSKLVHEVHLISSAPFQDQATFTISSYKCLVTLVIPRGRVGVSVTVSYQAEDWIPEASGCYRPHYYSRKDSPETENNVITPMEPVMISISDRASDLRNPGYDAGLYCKWLLEAKDGDLLTFRILDSLIKPVQEDCGYDGLILYDGSSPSHTQYGPFCGGSALKNFTMKSTQNRLLVVFYSDSRGGFRANGTFRALVSSEECSAEVMNTATKTLTDSCQIVMSPNFPGLVEPGLWTWTLQGPEKAYFSLYLYYIRGPGIEGDCEQYFRIVELAHDFSQLQQYSTHMLLVCGSIDLFLPSRIIKSPPHSKVLLELNTVRKSIANRWEFKIYFTVAQMEEPKGLEKDTTTCPDSYIAYREYCYRYYPWGLRHYRPDEYHFQDTWTKALTRCQAENGSLVSIHSEEEANFIKYLLATPGYWYWDGASFYQRQHRLIYIGLTERENHYQWSDGSNLGYSDWYEPPPSWAQPAVYNDTQVRHLLYLQNPQPTSDVASTCSVMMLVSPFSSTNWAKIPCDYPIFRAGVICKQPRVRDNDDGEKEYKDQLPQEITQELTTSGRAVCAEGHFMMNGQCFYLKDNPYSSSSLNAINNYEDVQTLCTINDDYPAALDLPLFNQLKLYLTIWRHDVDQGDIWLSSDTDSDICRAVRVHKEHKMDDHSLYETVEFNCSNQGDMSLQQVLCVTQPTVLTESCGQHEFTCTNGMCILIDNVCDRADDCLDKSDEIDCGCGESEFECDSGECISVSLFCDGTPHCSDHSDEAKCVAEECGAAEFNCGDGHCIEAGRVCDFVRDCHNGNDETDALCHDGCRGFQCFSGLCLPKLLYRDTISDCPGLSLEDEIELPSLVQGDLAGPQNTSTQDNCSEGFIHCDASKKQCYARGQACVYNTLLADEKRNLSVQTSCRNGAHLRMSCGDIDCAGMFHCPGSYCIPYNKLCNGMKDCPGGQDEKNCTDHICPAMFKCKGSGQCLPHTERCDGTPQCLLHRDDEKYCGELDPVCSVCSCKGYVATCSNQQDAVLPATEHNKSRHLRALLLDHNRFILHKNSLAKLHWLCHLNLAYNQLTGSLPVGVFKDLANLRTLNLSHNGLTEVTPGIFAGLKSIKIVDLSHNFLSLLTRSSLTELSPIQHLLITHNKLGTLEVNTFKDLTKLKELNSDAYKYCCIAKQAEVCTPEADEFSSCEDLMANYALQISIWVLGSCAFCGNLFVVIWRIKTDRQKVSSFFIINLGCSDFLMGVYMLVIASVDVYYRGRYSAHADAWRSSGLCQFAGIVAMLSSEVSVFMLTAITCDRAMAILFPLRVGNVRMKHARIVAATGWAISFILTILPALKIPYFGDAFFGRTGVCLPFQITNRKDPGWEYSVFIFLVINLMSFVVIFIGYAAIFLRVKTSMKEMGTKSTASTNEYDLAKKLALIVVTDFMCWVPIILIGFAALGGATIPPQVSAWIAVFILPLNSAINPLLYTISAIDCRGSQRKNIGRGNASNSTYVASRRVTKTTSLSVLSAGSLETN